MISQSVITVSDTHLNLTPTSIFQNYLPSHQQIIIVEFNNDLTSSKLILHTAKLLPQLLDSYDSILHSILDKHASLIFKFYKSHKLNPWYMPALLALKSVCHHLEHEYISSHSALDFKILCITTKKYHKLIAHANRCGSK